jgi:plasmid stabilization system protein ParE
VKSRRVEIVPEVLDDIRVQVRFIAQDSIDNALAWEDRIMAALAALADFHGHALDTDAGSRLGYPVRKLVFERTYLIHYHVDEAADLVRVVRFRHGARFPPPRHI